MRAHSALKTSFAALTLFTAVILLTSAMGLIPAADGAEAKAEWPHWRGPERTGISAEKGWLGDWPDEGPKVLWRGSVGTGFSSMSVCNGRVYTMGNTATKANDKTQRDQVFCLDAKTGKEIWKHDYACKLTPLYYKGGPSATPTVDGDKVYTFSKEGHVFCLEADTGKEVWTRNVQEKDGLTPPKWGFAGSVLILNDLAIINAGAGGMALKKATGEVAWKGSEGSSGYSTPLPFSAGGSSGVAMFSAQALMAVDPATGKTLWQVPWKTAYDVNAAEPVFVGDKLFITSGYGAGCALMQVERSGLTEVWRNKSMSNQCNSCVLHDSHLYGFDGNVGGKGVLRCLDLETGGVKWSKKALGTGSVMLADEKLIILSESGLLVIAAATPELFEELQSAQVLKGLCWTVPVLCEGMIYARCAEGDLVCVDAGTRKKAGEKSEDQ